MEDFISKIFRMLIKTFYACKCYPFLDVYTNYESSDLSETIKRRDEVFPKECEKAFEFGVNLVEDRTE